MLLPEEEGVGMTAAYSAMAHSLPCPAALVRFSGSRFGKNEKQDHGCLLPVVQLLLSLLLAVDLNPHTTLT